MAVGLQLNNELAVIIDVGAGRVYDQVRVRYGCSSHKLAVLALITVWCVCVCVYVCVCVHVHESEI